MLLGEIKSSGKISTLFIFSVKLNTQLYFAAKFLKYQNGIQGGVGLFLR